MPRILLFAGGQMAQPLVDDELWSIVEPLLPKPKRRRQRHPGRKPLDPRKALSGILFVLKSGIPWEMAARGIDTLIARCNTEHGSGLGATRWVIERTIAWLHQFPASARAL